MNVQIGFHVSIAGGLQNAVDNASKIGCTAFQIFTKNPRGWAEKVLDARDVQMFKLKLRHSGIISDAVAVHMPYLPNLSAPNGELYKKSIDSLISELHRCFQLEIPNLVVHLGSHLGSGPQNGIDQLVNSVNTATDHSESSGRKNGKVTILLENSAGQKNSIGSQIEEIQSIFNILGKTDYGLCIDTCHLFAAGYDLSTESGASTLFEKIDSHIGIENIKIIHLNDSKGDLGSNLDRHYHIGLGKIGQSGLRHLVNYKKLTNVPFIMETPIDSVRNDLENITFVKTLLTK